MKIAIPRVNDPAETRIPVIPAEVKKWTQSGADVIVQTGLGESLNIPDEEFKKAGAQILADRNRLISNADILIAIRPLHDADIQQLKSGCIYAGMLDPFNHKDYVIKLKDRFISTLCMEMLPRSTFAQKMDVLSSQASLAGYVAVILAAGQLNKILPMMMTPAGTIKPSRVFVIGAGVAGLQAIATAKRLGARVEAFDTRPVVEEEVKSLGAKFIKIDLGETGQTKDGYAKQLTAEQLELQRQGMAKACAQSDIVITTAQLFGRKAPRIITADMIEQMKPGSVIVDLAAESGGNVEGSKPGEIVKINGVQIIGTTNLPGLVPDHASQMLSANFFHLIDTFWDKENKLFKMDLEHDILKSCLITHEGKVSSSLIQEHYNK